MTEVGEILAEEIRREGPIPFRRFMEVALYDPHHGYYRSNGDSRNDPFGKTGDFFTAQQMQPVFGNLIAARVRSLFRQMGSPPDFTIVEPGPGRGEMAQAFSEWRYVPVEIGSHVPDRVRGVFFSNELFDALPVEAVLFSRGEFRRAGHHRACQTSALLPRAARSAECERIAWRRCRKASWPSGKRNLPGLWRPRMAPKSGEGGCN